MGRVASRPVEGNTCVNISLGGGAELRCASEPQFEFWLDSPADETLTEFRFWLCESECSRGDRCRIWTGHSAWAFAPWNGWDFTTDQPDQTTQTGNGSPKNSPRKPKRGTFAFPPSARFIKIPSTRSKPNLPAPCFAAPSRWRRTLA